MALAGVGAMLVGVFPEDTIYWAHIAGADLAFLLGNVALIVLGLTLRVSRWFSWYCIATASRRARWPSWPLFSSSRTIDSSWSLAAWSASSPIRRRSGSLPLLCLCSGRRGRRTPMRDTAWIALGWLAAGDLETEWP
jgi:hypothetical protein